MMRPTAGPCAVMVLAALCQSTQSSGCAQECPVSKVPFAPEGGALPRLLTCGHTVSHAALEKCYASQVASGEASGGRLECPVCHLSVPVSALGISAMRVSAES